MDPTEEVLEPLTKIKSSISCYLIRESQNDQRENDSVFYGLRFSNLIMSLLQNKRKFKKCCNSEDSDDIQNAVPGIMASDLKFPSEN